MTQRIEKIERERELLRGAGRGERSQSAERTRDRRKKERKAERREKKKSQAERKDYIGDFGFRVSSGPKPISRFSVFPPWREPPLELDAHCTSDETRRDLPPSPLPLDFVTSHIKSRSTL